MINIILCRCEKPAALLTTRSALALQRQAKAQEKLACKAEMALARQLRPALQRINSRSVNDFYWRSDSPNVLYQESDPEGKKERFYGVGLKDY